MTTTGSEPVFAASVLQAEARAVADLAEAMSGEAAHAFIRATDVVCRCADDGGTVLVSGLGKSGLIGQKISATLASLGVPSHFIHPAEAAHGDLGRFRPADSVICISWSGETDEVVNLAAILRQDGLPIISMTGGPLRQSPEPWKPSSLERLATVALRLGLPAEAGGADYVAPTCSTTVTLAAGDALALLAARRRGFTSADFARRHPGGTLGELLRPVTDVLRFVVGKNLPVVRDDATVAEALRLAAQAGRRPGALLLVNPATGVLSGIFTDGDLRRLVLRDPGELARPVASVMTRNPRTLHAESRIRDAVRLIREHRQDEIPIVDASGKPVGILDVQDLIAMKLVHD